MNTSKYWMLYGNGKDQLDEESKWIQANTECYMAMETELELGYVTFWDMTSRNYRGLSQQEEGEDYKYYTVWQKVKMMAMLQTSEQLKIWRDGDTANDVTNLLYSTRQTDYFFKMYNQWQNNRD